MPRVARVRAGAASCGAREARARRQGVKGWRGRVLAVGRVLVGCVPAGVAPVRARPQGARQGAGRQDSGECGQGEEPGAKGSSWGASREQGQAPGHGDVVALLLVGQVPMVVAMSMAWLLRARV